MCQICSFTFRLDALEGDSIGIGLRLLLHQLGLLLFVAVAAALFLLESLSVETLGRALIVELLRAPFFCAFSLDPAACRGESLRWLFSVQP
ncbi:MAG: hypothetical protein RL701_1448 [Pseudomonadota bacterium]